MHEKKEIKLKELERDSEQVRELRGKLRDDSKEEKFTKAFAATGKMIGKMTPAE